MFSIPTEIIIGDNARAIRCQGDYRMVLDCFNALNDTELNEQERIFATLLIFYEDLTFESLLTLSESELEQYITEMFRFMNCGDDKPSGVAKNYKLYDWNKDSQLICSAVNNVTKFEIRSVDYLHWWTFMGYFNSVGESSFSTVVSIRNKIVKGKKLEKYEQEFRANNPGYFNWDKRTGKDVEIDDWLDKIWNK